MPAPRSRLGRAEKRFTARRSQAREFSDGKRETNLEGQEGGGSAEEFFGRQAFDAAGLGHRDEDDLARPKSVVLCGFRPEECAQFRMLLDEIGGAGYKVLPANRGESMHGTVLEAVEAVEVDWERPRESETMAFPSTGSPRCLLFCGMPRSEVDIVTAILDENGVKEFAVEVATEANAGEPLGKVVVDAVKGQRDGMRQRTEFMSWKSDLSSGEDALKAPIFKDDATRATFSSALETTSVRPAGPAEPTMETEGKETGMEDVEGSETREGPEEGEEEVADGVFSKPLDLDGVRRDLAQDMKDDKVFMDPWHARGLQKDETRDIVKEEERDFIRRCQERQEREEGGGPAKRDEGAASGDLDPVPLLSEGPQTSSLTEEEVMALLERLDDEDLKESVLRRYSDRLK